MNINEIYTLCNYITNKDVSGNAFTPNQFNDIVEILNRPFFKKKVEESGYFENRKSMSYNDTLNTSKNLHKFIVNETIAAAGGTTYTYAYFLGASDSDTDFLIELIEEAEYQDRVGDSILAPSASAPVAMERGDNVVIKPDTVANVNLSYYRFPTDPFLDYYIDVNGAIQFLSAGATHTWTTSEIDSSGTTRTTGQPDWTSLTVELEYNEDMHEDFMNEILSRAGVKLKEGQITQYAEAMKAEQKNM